MYETSTAKGAAPSQQFHLYTLAVDFFGSFFAIASLLLIDSRVSKIVLLLTVRVVLLSDAIQSSLIIGNYFINNLLAAFASLF